MSDDLNEAQIARLVRAFYARARADDLLGPVFEAAVDDWEKHLARLTRFWSVVMLGAGRFDGNPMGAHARHPITPEMFDRWLALWADVTDELFGPAPAAAFQQRAARIAESLKLGLFYRPAAAG
jgi:hemoglobin